MPERFYTPQQRGFEAVDHVGLAITIVEDGQQHIGVLHKDESNNELAMLHLAWHCRLRNDPPEATYGWVAPAVPSARARQVAALCRKLWRSNGQEIPYAFSAPSDCFDGATGVFLGGSTNLGLTCATFILAVFHAAGLPLVRYETWAPANEKDKAWQRHVVEKLREHGATAAHVQAVEREVGAVRYRPEQVAGGAACESQPAAYDDAERLGQEILQALEAQGAIKGG